MLIRIFPLKGFDIKYVAVAMAVSDTGSVAELKKKWR